LTLGNDSQEPQSGTEEPKPQKIKAEDNPWYLLATLYGVPGLGDVELQEKNRATWNGYFSANLALKPELRAKLIGENRHPEGEQAGFSPEEQRQVEKAFGDRCKELEKDLTLPASSTDIDFSNVEFAQDCIFDEYLFSRNSFFRGAEFSRVASFRGAIFSNGAWFDGASFCQEAMFDGTIFYGAARFGGAVFSAVASFHRATLRGDGWFANATFSRDALFRSATFSGLASFGSATFSSGASFEGATFMGWAIYERATFSREAHFIGAAFSGAASFRNAIFGDTSSFVNVEMKGKTSFDGVTFKTEPPRFFEAKLHQDTVWRGITWPPNPNNKDEAGKFIDAYACLKLEMDRLKKHEDELDFFALELQSRRVLLGTCKGLPIAIYGLFSDYGRSYLRPFAALVVVAAIGAGAFWYFDARTFWDALGLSAANTLNVFGFRRDFNLSIETPLAWLHVLSAAQTILGAILLFLLGLGIRNKFRMK
jgi:uncharacterized protein YjbI with pentapeptide repeats